MLSLVDRGSIFVDILMGIQMGDSICSISLVPRPRVLGVNNGDHPCLSKDIFQINGTQPFQTSLC